VPLELACIPVIAPVFFGMPAVEANIHNLDFDEKLALLSPIHLAWAKLVKKNITQQKNDGKDYEKILSRIYKGDKAPISKYVTPNTFGVELLDAPPLSSKCSLFQRINGIMHRKRFKPFSNAIRALFVSRVLP
jgi:hypothetical protein